MFIFNNPEWVGLSVLPYVSFEDTPLLLFEEINGRLDLVQSVEPVVTIVIAAWNEEANILNCINSLSKQKTVIPFEIVVVNNNSDDSTQKILDKLHIKALFYEKQGCGPARQFGQENAKGKYVLLADADCLYPSRWVDLMTNMLQKPNVVCVYGRYSFIGQEVFPRWKLFVFEMMKDIIAELRHIKRPYLNSYGMSMGYIKKLGLKVGYIDHNIRGEDGRLCFDLMNYGEIRQVRSKWARVWTKPRTLELDGSFTKVLYTRIKKEFERLPWLLKNSRPHNTKTSRN